MTVLRKRSLFVPVLGVCLLLSLSHGSAASDDRPVGVMSALVKEIALLEAEMKIEKSEVRSGVGFRVGELGGKKVVICHSDVGKVNAAMTAMHLIHTYHVSAIIFTGIAGSLDPELGIGDIVIATEATEHDFGTFFAGRSAIQPRGIPVRVDGIRERRRWFRADEQLVGIARNAADKVDLPEVPTVPPRKPRVVLGRIVSGDQFVASSEKRDELRSTFSAHCVEMEGGAVAHVCEVHGVPWVLIRANSDLANEDARVDAQTFGDYAAAVSNLIVKKMLELY